MRRRSSWPIPCQAASSYAASAGQELLSMLRPHADAASTSWEAREDLGQGSNFESCLPVRSRLAPTHRWLVAIGQERVQERLCKGPASTSIANACARGSKVGGDNMYRNKGVYFRKSRSWAANPQTSARLACLVAPSGVVYHSTSLERSDQLNPQWIGFIRASQQLPAATSSSPSTRSRRSSRPRWSLQPDRLWPNHNNL